MNFLKSHWLTITVLLLVAVAGYFIYKEVKKNQDAKNAEPPSGATSVEISDALAESIINGATEQINM